MPQRLVCSQFDADRRGGSTAEQDPAGSGRALLLADVLRLIGLAPGPALTGVLADHLGLHGALRVIPLVALLGAAAFAIGRSRYERDLRRAAGG